MSLRMNSLGGFWAGKPKQKTLTYITSGQQLNSTSGTSFTFSSVSIGTPSPNRLVIVCIGNNSKSAGKSISGVTIGGVTATAAVNNFQTGPIQGIGIWYAVVPTGTTGNIAITFSGTDSQDLFYSVYTLTGYGSATPAQTATNNGAASGSSTSLTPSLNAVLIADFYVAAGTTATSPAISNSTNDAIQTSTGTPKEAFCSNHNLTPGTSSLTLAGTSTASGAALYSLIAAATWV